MPSLCACFRSIFQVHTETGNIWTHLLGIVLSLCLGILTLLPNEYFMASLQEKVVFGMLFLGAVLCLSFPWLFYIAHCHLGEGLVDFFNFGLFRNCTSGHGELCYSFYCSPQLRLIYLNITCTVGVSPPIWDCFCSRTWWVVRGTGNQDVYLKGTDFWARAVCDVELWNDNVGCGMTPPWYFVNTKDNEDGLLEMHQS